VSIVVLDSGPLGLATHPNPGAEAKACQQWVRELIEADVRVMVPEISDYEVRRELMRARRRRGLQLLDEVTEWAEYICITTLAMRRAAEFWAEIRSHGLPTDSDERLDADAILASQAVTLELEEVVIATTNVRHLSRFCDAALWSQISPE